MFGLSDIGVEGRVAHKGGGLYDWHLLVDVKLTVSHLFFVASLCFMMGYGSWVHADETTHLGASTEAVSDGDDEGVVDKLLSRFGEGSATWSLGVGLAAGVYPHYPGSKQDETAVAPFPYAEYHSDRIELDRDGLAAKLFQSDRFKLDLSVNGALPVSAKNNDLRTGMDDLELMIELGPELEITLATWDKSILRFDIPARANFEVTTSHAPSQAGWSTDPRIHFEQNFDNWEWEIYVGALWASQSYQDVFYTVEAKDVTATRPLYQAKSGLLAWRLSVTVERRIGDWIMLGYLRQMDLAPSANRDSPLLGQDSYLAGGVAAIWMFKSK